MISGVARPLATNLCIHAISVGQNATTYRKNNS